MITYTDIFERTQNKSLYSTELDLVLAYLNENINDGNFSSNHTTYWCRPAFEITTKLEFSRIHKGKSISWHEQFNIAGNDICNISFNKDLKELLSKTYKNVEVGIFKTITPNEVHSSGIESFETVVVNLKFLIVKPIRQCLKYFNRKNDG